MKKLIFLFLFFGFLISNCCFAQTYITVDTKSKGHQWTAAEQNQIIGALKDGNFAIVSKYLLILDATKADTAWIYDDGDTTRFESDNPIKIGAGSLIINNSGEVGVGELSPSDLLHVTGNNACLRLEDDSGNYGRIKTGNSQLTIEVDPDNAVASTDIVFKIDGVEVGRFEQGKGFQSKRGFATELWDVVGGHFETAVVNTEYYSPNQHGGIYGTIYRQYFNTVLTSTNPRLDTGNNVTGMIDYSIQFKYTGDDRGLGHGNATAYGSSDNHIYVMLGGASGAGNLVFAPTGYTIQRGWIDYTK